MVRNIFKWKALHQGGSKVVAKVAANADSAPTSTTGSKNSQASALAAAELHQGLAEILSDLGSEEYPDYQDVLKMHLDQLQEEAETYTNSSVRASIMTGTEWSCSSFDAEMIHSACCCSADVYRKDSSENTAAFDLIYTKGPSLSGTHKAFSIWRKSTANSLIVAIRGSKALVDHSVNFSCAPSEMQLDSSRTTVKVHGGYLACAKALIPDLEKQIKKATKDDDSIRHVIFTGHSAGGAVASLICTHFLTQSEDVLDLPSISLITFGSPPVTVDDITQLIKSLPRAELVLSFVNELDFVTRADQSYIRSIVDLYRVRYDLPPVGQRNASLQLQLRLATWPLPPPDFYQVGEIVLLRPNLVLPELSSELETGDNPDGGPGCMALPYSEFAGLLFCDIAVHKCSNYLERVKALRSLAAPEASG